MLRNLSLTILGSEDGLKFPKLRMGLLLSNLKQELFLIIRNSIGREICSIIGVISCSIGFQRMIYCILHYHGFGLLWEESICQTRSDHQVATIVSFSAGFLRRQAGATLSDRWKYEISGKEAFVKFL